MEQGDFVLKASTGIVKQFEDDYKKQKTRLSEFLGKQTEVLNALQKERAKLNAMDCLQLDNMMLILKFCQVRLHAIKERMHKASMKSAKIKEKSLKILQIKQNAALERELKREAQLTREQDMVARSSNFKTKDNTTIP